jgi:hypothetical protein
MRTPSMDAEELGGFVGIAVLVVFVATCVIGWCMNLYAIGMTYDLPLNGKFILRVVGIFVAPIGSFMGLFF